VTDNNGNECIKARGQRGEWRGENDDGKHRDGEVGGEMRMTTGQGGSNANKGRAMQMRAGMVT
jgi:hypothetical protein